MEVEVVEKVEKVEPEEHDERQGEGNGDAGERRVSRLVLLLAWLVAGVPSVDMSDCWRM